MGSDNESNSDSKPAANLFDILKGRFGQSPALSRRLHEAEVLQKWKEIVGIQISNQARAVGIFEGKLRVEVVSAAWRTELHFRTTEILEKINKAFPVEPVLIRDIEWMDPSVSKRRDFWWKKK